MQNTTDQVSESFLAHMPDVARCQSGFRELSQSWRLIEAAAKMNCPAEARLLLPSVVATRTRLAQLETALVANLVQQRVRHVMRANLTRAQYALDLLVRNLFERTADVGFLAADTALCRFAAGLDGDSDAIRARLTSYRDKYTVYDDVLVIAPDGRVLLQLDQAAPVARSTDALIAQTLSADGYVETFRATDLRPAQQRALLYSHVMRHPESGEPVAVLCLSFRFEHEMQAIFGAYGDPAGRANMLLLDAHNRVISSADPQWLAPGAVVPVNPGASARPLMFCGREYLVCTAASQGYQDYPGPPGWQTQVMLPLELALRTSHEPGTEQCAPELLQGLLSHAHSFNPALHELMSSVSATTHAIRRIVWNGKVTSAADPAGSGKLHTILDQITETGERSNALFSRATEELYQTVLASGMRAAESTSQLLVDMLDRSLYERANDCRWWALADRLRAGLAAQSGADTEGMGQLLAHINSLYTVYRRLFVYERSGRIVASTGSQDIVGTLVPQHTVAAVCALQDEAGYHAEPFGASPLCGGEPTFVFHAPVRHPEHAAVTGAIGIVFDSTRQLHDMLASGVAGRPDMHAFFASPDGRVFAGTDPSLPAGALPGFDTALLQAADGRASVSRILAWRGQYCVAACTRASGYREFRADGNAHEPVLAVVLQSFGAVRDAADLAGLVTPAIDASDSGEDFALFEVGRTLMALPAATVQEAVPFARVQPAPRTDRNRLGMLDVALPGQSRHFVWVFDLASLVGADPAIPGERSQVLLLRHAGMTVGLRVDDVHSVQRFASHEIAPLALGIDGLSSRVIKANQGSLLIQELDAALLLTRLGTRSAT